MEEYHTLPGAEKILAFHCPRYREIPNLGLYMDQVVTIVEDSLKVFAICEEEKIITSAMVNNYVKHKVVSSPQKKKYYQPHVACLLVICILKQVLSLSEIAELIALNVENSSAEEAYDFFCQELERALAAAFTNRDFSLQQGEQTHPKKGLLVESAVLSFANKIYLQQAILAQTKKEPEKKKQG